MNYSPYAAMAYQTPYSMIQPQQRMAEQTYVGIKGRPVSSIEEVRATSIDFDGSIFYFPDLANRRIYTKQINLDGTSTLNVYELSQPQETPSVQYVTREEFEKFKEALQAAQEQAKQQMKLDF